MLNLMQHLPALLINQRRAPARLSVGHPVCQQSPSIRGGSSPLISTGADFPFPTLLSQDPGKHWHIQTPVAGTKTFGDVWRAATNTSLEGSWAQPWKGHEPVELQPDGLRVGGTEG